MTHTPGPWIVHDRFPDTVCSASGTVIATFDNGNKESNAQLGAAAPDLVAASQPIVAVVAALEGVYGFDDSKPVDCRHYGAPYNDFPPLTYGDLRRLAAAVAKAEGR